MKEKHEYQLLTPLHLVFYALSLCKDNSSPMFVEVEEQIEMDSSVPLTRSLSHGLYKWAPFFGSPHRFQLDLVEGTVMAKMSLISQGTPFYFYFCFCF